MEVILYLYLAFTLEYELQYNAEDLVYSDIPHSLQGNFIKFDYY